MELMKAKYIKRIPKPGGGFRYVYGPAKGKPAGTATTGDIAEVTGTKKKEDAGEKKFVDIPQTMHDALRQMPQTEGIANFRNAIEGEIEPGQRGSVEVSKKIIEQAKKDVTKFDMDTPKGYNKEQIDQILYATRSLNDALGKSHGGIDMDIDMSHYDGLATLEKARGRMDQSNMFKLLGVLPAGTVAETNSQSIIALDSELARRGMRTQGDEEIQAIRENK